ncbi:MAG: 4-phosphoerythronate dehydrogenase [Pseudomonadota bacterium]|nr:4-phosphoerythronate dehydrogenase [Pseudomonadota bacterium]
MRIIADPNIAYVGDAFASLGDLCVVPGRDWTPEIARDADLLLVRSVTRVDAALLEGSRVRFVGTATSGVDHIDLEYLSRKGIAFAAAPGSNATAVAEYVLSALLILAEQRGAVLKGMTAGIIGCGHVGARVTDLLGALGVECIIHDPPLQELTGEVKYRTLDDALSAHVVSLHVPLTASGSHPTVNLIGLEEFTRMRNDAILINTARGGVIDEPALRTLLMRRPRMAAVIDCWCHEPDIDVELSRRAAIGTPHIAGYSDDAKLRATEMLYQSVCEFLSVPTEWQPPVAADTMRTLCLDEAETDEDLLRRAVFACYDPRDDHRALAEIDGLPLAERGPHFDALRAHYRARREFSAVEVLAPSDRPAFRALLRALGFGVAADTAG